MSIANYTAKVKVICNALGSIDITVGKEEMVQICLGGLAQRYGHIRTTILTREKPLSFFDLQYMLIVEESQTSRSRTTQSDNWML